ncbi:MULTISPECIES: methylated-DNA--[protein]-cysteine S-methyltransferase [Comamonas]|uniref:methylated-DNA--[protein]-cysteine S-methyltransferase n=1 Tax=Comamonas TaxID=283 RepID=UPI001C497BB3|nr:MULTISPECIES: methylated-DNA--[protein]-cysteine S-methyltransferase [Comamonas]MBV7419936.1 methylated-DNA--[protein]-cysteine S-methyltransferase [Comamonas sp. CMM03]MDH0047472.1 methylated-DNA--[protein]-cysteine S-methyltransferase [Comamonas terrigena]MDH0509892.1 methylated-DNA--[protein]-cysteine S-methyltransferase [Comamonas terrigena]MDH1089729.1 methylated-DNA--[protein]-cysteine S-methyltransferase [Comamonas terrigena]MDH1501598.1 methylated-DNA--[protein]-cysteine S-methyltra
MSAIRPATVPSAAASDTAALVARCCRWLEGEAPPALSALAQRVGLSPWQLHRLFKQATGLTPKAYAKAYRTQAVQAALQPGQSSSVTDALYGSGYAASSSFYKDAPRMLGMAPGAFRAGGARQTIRFAVGECSLGSLLVAATERGVCCVQLGNDAEALVRVLQDRFPQAELVGGDAAFEATMARVAALVERPAQGLDLPLDVQGTAFQQRVWQALRAIPAGDTVSYTELARRIGQPTASRAVAGACAANPVAVAIPCHRVVRNDGSISGYRWGVERKRALLLREAAQAGHDVRVALPGLF